MSFQFTVETIPATIRSTERRPSLYDAPIAELAKAAEKDGATSGQAYSLSFASAEDAATEQRKLRRAVLAAKLPGHLKIRSKLSATKLTFWAVVKAPSKADAAVEMTE